MLRKLSNRLRREDEGFTLIELMVVVLIIAILIAIAIPTFLGARGRAQDRAAQSSLRNALTNAKAIYTDNETYVDASVTKMSAAEPSLTFRAAGVASATPPNDISIGNGTPVAPTTAAQVFVGAALSSNNKCWFIQDVVAPGVNAGTRWQVDDGQVGGLGACTAAAAPNSADAEWVQSPGSTIPF